ncbi:MAG TPA: SDR family NAD(P)-dependent oxidoreductase [Ktedonobacteraceae bacterium]
MGVLEGKVAVITGSSKGLGLAIAQAYEREGAAVVLASRSSAALAEALERQGARASWQVTDVGDLEQVKALADHAVKMFGKIDIWVNNAGYGGIYGPTATIDTQDFERVTRTNIFGEYYGSWVALQHFLVQKTGGKLINLLGRGDITPAHCLTKNLPLSSSQNHLLSKCFPPLRQDHLFAYAHLQSARKLLSCVH